MKRSNLPDLVLLMTLIGILTCNSIIAQKSDFLNTLLLKNYKPVSIFNVQVTNLTKARFTAIDAHTHSSYANNSNEIEKWIRDMDSADEHFYERTIPPYHWPLYGLQLNDEVLSKVYYENASRILKIK